MSEAKKFFNTHASKWMQMWYQQSKKQCDTKYRQEFARLFREVKIKKGDFIMDAGCGTGVLAPFILRRIGKNGRLYELDYAEKMIAENKKLHKDERIKFLVKDIHLINFADKFNGVFLFSCLPHFDNKQLVMKKIWKALKDGGWLAIAHFSSRKKLNKMHHRANSAIRHHMMPTNKELITMLEQAGFTIAKLIEEPNFYCLMAKKIRD